MATPLRVLIVEDRPSDVALVANELRLADFEPHWDPVETEADYLTRLEPSLDLILADFSLPQFDACRPLESVNRSGFDIPFIVVSGSIGEELAIQIMSKSEGDGMG